MIKEANKKKTIENVDEQSLAKKYYDAVFSQLEDVTVESMPLFMNGILIKDKKGNEILIYTTPYSNAVYVEASYSDGATDVTKLVLKNEEWLVV